MDSRDSRRSAQLARRDPALRQGTRGELRHAVPRLVGGGIAVYALLVVIGLLLTRVFQDGPLVAADRRTSQWFFEHRTPVLDTWTHVGSFLSDTAMAIALTALIVVGLRLWLKRWREAITVLVSIVGSSSCW